MSRTKLPPGVSVIRGAQPGPTVALVAGIHGNETAPLRALRAWRSPCDRATLRGQVYCIIGSPAAIRRNQRFVDENLNRCFGRSGRRQTIEARRARQLEPILRTCDAVLDLHASNSRATKPFLIAEPRTMVIGRALPLPTVVHGFDGFEPGGVDQFTNASGGRGLCAECGYLNDPKSRRVAQRCITAFLQAAGCVPGRPPRSRKRRWRLAQLYRNSAPNFTPRTTWADFAPIRRGQIIGLDGQRPVRAKQPGRLLFVRSRNKPGQECFLRLVRAGA